MKIRLLVASAVFVGAMSAAQAQLTQDIVLLPPNPSHPDTFQGVAGFNHPSPAGISDTVFFTAPFDGELTLSLGFLPIPFVPASANFFEVVRLDQTSFTVSGSEVTLGPFDIVAGPHMIDIEAVATSPRGVPQPVQPQGSYGLVITLAPIPEPQTWLLLVAGLAAGALLRKSGRYISA
ncbi:MAG: PEP-CTERM sorting domain-containing protein, partial [Rhizobacter sp.]